jgi:two-component system, NarL family, sensor kinase
MLVTQSIYLSSVLAESKQLSPAAEKALEDSAALIDQMSREVRTISYVLHPPLLDEAGLVSAIRCYVEGFAERSKIKIEMNLPADLGRLTSELEIAMFRIVQECMTNIHRHSGSQTATILLSRSTDRIVLEIRDAGKGMPAQKKNRAMLGKLTGVGLRGMRERVTQLGGVVEIRTSPCGTAVIARLPIPNVLGS